MLKKHKSKLQISKELIEKLEQLTHTQGKIIQVQSDYITVLEKQNAELEKKILDFSQQKVN